MELLPESIDAVAESKIKSERSVSYAKGAVGVEVVSGKVEHRASKSLQQKSYWQRVLENIDPLFYFTCCLSTVVFAGGFLIWLQRSELQLGVYLNELKASNAELAKRLTDSEIGSVTPVLENEIDAASSDSTGDAAAPTQTIPDSASSDFANPEMTIDGNGRDGSEAIVPIKLVALQNPVDEIADLKMKLQEQTQQIDFLALENHELRLQVEFGSHGKADEPWQPFVDITEDKNRSVDILATQSASTDVKPLAAEMKRLVVNGYNAYIAGNHVLARDLYSQALQLNPFDRDANLGVAASATALGQYKLAADRCRHLLSINADDQEAFSAMLGLSETSTMIETELLTHIEKNANEPAILYSIVGHYYAQANRWSQASEMFIKSLASVKDMPPPADYYFNLAVSLEHAAQPDRALEYYLQALSTPNGATFEREVVQRQLRELTR